MARITKRINDLTRAPFLGLIRLYQYTLSLDHGPLRRQLAPQGYCKFSPSCSEYTYQAIAAYGVFRGFGLGGSRILRCNPWSNGGDDPVPPCPDSTQNQ